MWIGGALLAYASQFVKRRTSLPSGVASTLQVAGVAALLLAVLAMLWGFAVLARALSDRGDLVGAITLWSIVAGYVLLPASLLGGLLLFPALLALIVRGRLAGVDVRLPAVALFAGLLAGVSATTWAGGVEGPIHFNLLSMLGATAEGAALIWFGKKTAPLGR